MSETPLPPEDYGDIRPEDIEEIRSAEGAGLVPSEKWFRRLDAVIEQLERGEADVIETETLWRAYHCASVELCNTQPSWKSAEPGTEYYKHISRLFALRREMRDVLRSRGFLQGE